MLRKLLILAYYYPPSSAAGGTRPFQLAKYLGRLGAEVRILTATPQTSEADTRVVYVRDPASPLNKRSLVGLTHMTLRKFFFAFEESMVWAWPLSRTAEKLIANSPRDWTIFSTFPPVSTHVAALRLRHKYPVRWIADFRDPLAGSPSRRAVAEVAGPLSPKVDAWLERRILHRADLAIANTDVVADIWRRKYPALRPKIHHLWNGFDPDDPPTAAPIPDRPYRVLLHAGAIYQGRHPGALIDSLDRLTANGRLNPSHFRLCFVGEIVPGTIPNPDVLERLATLGCVERIPRVSRSEAQRLSGEADYLLLIDLNDGLQVPSKLFEYIRIGRPILALTGQNSPAARILTQSGIRHALIFPGADAATVDAEVLRFLSLPTEPLPASSWFEENFDAERRTKRLVQLASGIDQARNGQRE